MKNIAFFTLSLRRGGAERVVSTLCNSLVVDHKVYLIVLDLHLDYELDKRVIVKKLSPFGDVKSSILKVILLPVYTVFLYFLLRRENISILFSFLLRPNFISCFVKKLMGSNLKVIISERSNPHAQYSSNSLSDKLNRFLIKYLYPIADCITVNSYGSSYILKEYYKIKNRIEIIRNPIAPNFFKRKDKLFDTNGFYHFITVGRLDEGKNHIVLLKAIVILLNLSSRNFKVSIIGDGPLRKYLMGFCEKNNIKNHVDFLGYRGDVDEWLKKADCFVFVSKREGFPNVLLEAVASGLRVISTDCPYGPREMLTEEDVLPNAFLANVEHVKNGLLVPVDRPDLTAKAMMFVMDNDHVLISKDDVESTILQKYAVATIVQQYEKLFF